MRPAVVGALALALVLPACDARAKPRKPPDAATCPPPSFAPTLKKLLPSVLNVFSEVEPEPGKNDISIGTGVIVDASGGFVTAAHIVKKARLVKVELHDRTLRDARIVGVDEGFDLAYGTVTGPGPFTPAALGDSDRAEIGDWVVAVGQPFSLPFSASVGIISGKGRTERDLQARAPSGAPLAWDLIQTDTSINQGNSGGPIATLGGEVVGINVMIHPDTSSRVAFAIPSNLVGAVVAHLKRGKLARGWIGIEVSDARDLAPADLLRLGLPDSRGVILERVTPSSPAAKAGLRAGDVVIGLGGRRVSEWPELRWRIATAGVGATLELRVWRDRKEHGMSVVTAHPPATKN